MGGKRMENSFGGPKPMHGINNVPFRKGEWARLKDWCQRHGLKMGDVAAEALDDWMRRHKV